MAIEIVEAPMVGKILRVEVAAGSQIAEGDTICVIESMKMENFIFAPVSGTIKELKVAPNQVVQAYDVVAVIEC
jgi:biotin carboxyl carrier protein